MDLMDQVEGLEIISFKVRMSTSCGLGPFSSVLRIDVNKETSEKPEKMSKIVTEVDGCVARFTWKENPKRLNETLSYVISVQKSRDLTFKQLVDCKPVVLIEGTMTCEVPIISLNGAPFQLKNGDYLIAQGYAKNSQENRGETSDSSDKVTVVENLPPILTKRP